MIIVKLNAAVFYFYFSHLKIKAKMSYIFFYCTICHLLAEPEIITCPELLDVFTSHHDLAVKKTALIFQFM